MGSFGRRAIDQGDGTVGRFGHRYCQRPSSFSPGSRGEKRSSSRVDAVARADLDLPLLDSRLEAVERAHRRAVDDQALEVVDAAVTGTDEALGRLDPPHRAAEVRAAGRDRDVLALALALEERVALAHVDGRLARLAHAGGDGDRAREVVVLGEVARRTDVLPGPSSSSNSGPSAKPIAGSAIAAVAIPPSASTPPPNRMRRVIDSPSK